ncbi:O-methyltransferase [Ornithobacterium rhinotracheale]|uniref:O-methyltransferase n=1 Tax=Ornithobacterium rhinotracheale TaxID=28251 RepID=UPI004035A1A8
MFKNDILPEDLCQYITAFSSDEPQMLKEIREKTEQEMHQPHMISGVLQGRLLSFLAKMIQPKRILEIGTYTGYATLCLAEGLAPDGKIVTLDRDERAAAFYRPFFAESAFSHQIEAHLVDAMDFLDQKMDEPWDLVFLDANKKKYREYVEKLLPQMRQGGIILADNVLWKNKVLHEIDSKDKMTQSLHDFNIFVKNDERLEAVMLPIRDGLTLIRKI